MLNSTEVGTQVISSDLVLQYINPYSKYNKYLHCIIYLHVMEVNQRWQHWAGCHDNMYSSFTIVHGSSTAEDAVSKFNLQKKNSLPYTTCTCNAYDSDEFVLRFKNKSSTWLIKSICWCNINGILTVQRVNPRSFSVKVIFYWGFKTQE